MNIKVLRKHLFNQSNAHAALKKFCSPGDTSSYCFSTSVPLVNLLCDKFGPTPFELSRTREKLLAEGAHMCQRVLTVNGWGSKLVVHQISESYRCGSILIMALIM